MTEPSTEGREAWKGLQKAQDWRGSCAAGRCGGRQGRVPGRAGWPAGGVSLELSLQGEASGRFK